MYSILAGIVALVWSLSPTTFTVTNYTCEVHHLNKMSGCSHGYLGYPVHPKFASCDKSRLGQVWAIEGYGTVLCADTGNFSGNHIDVYSTSYQEAVIFGVQEREAVRLR